MKAALYHTITGILTPCTSVQQAQDAWMALPLADAVHVQVLAVV